MPVSDAGGPKWIQDADGSEWIQVDLRIATALVAQQPECELIEEKRNHQHTRGHGKQRSLDRFG